MTLCTAETLVLCRSSAEVTGLVTKPAFSPLVLVGAQGTVPVSDAMPLLILHHAFDACNAIR